jgi:hypothetical protein
MNEYFNNTPPTKNTVTFNNYKGSCNNIRTKSDTIQFLSTTGYNSAIIHPKRKIVCEEEAACKKQRLANDYTDLSILSRNNVLSPEMLAMHNELPKIRPLESTSFDEHGHATKTVVREIMLKRMPVTEMKYIVDGTKRDLRVMTNIDAKFLSYYDRLDDLFEELKEQPKYQIKLYTAFCALGPTVEDGFVLDVDVAKSGPVKCLSTSLNIKVMKEHATVNQKNIMNDKIFYNERNVLIRNGTSSCIFFGVLVSLQPLRLTQNKKISIEQCQIGDQYSYTITYPLDITSDKFDIGSSFNISTGCIEIHFRYSMKLGIGSKMCNRFGQKCEIADVRNLEAYAGYDVRGNLRKPQLLMNVTSTLGRLASGQVQEMLNDPNRALTPDGGILAESEYTVHCIDASTKLSVSQVRNDGMTNQNGFDANEMPSVALMLAKQHATVPFDNFGHFSNLVQGRNIKFTFT